MRPLPVAISPTAIVATRLRGRCGGARHWQALSVTSPEAPHAPRRPATLTHFGDTRVDDYFWLRDRDDPAVLMYLEAENEFAASALAGTEALRERVYDEIVARI